VLRRGLLTCTYLCCWQVPGKEYLMWQAGWVGWNACVLGQDALASCCAVVAAAHIFTRAVLLYLWCERE
jgi:hypothetical protein